MSLFDKVQNCSNCGIKAKYTCGGCYDKNSIPNIFYCSNNCQEQHWINNHYRKCNNKHLKIGWGFGLGVLTSAILFNNILYYPYRNYYYPKEYVILDKNSKVIQLKPGAEINKISI